MFKWCPYLLVTGGYLKCLTQRPLTSSIDTVYYITSGVVYGRDELEALAICCFGLHYKSHTHNLDTDLISSAAFGGYVIILVGGFAGHLMSTPFNKRIDIFFSLVGCAVFVAAGAMNIKVYDGSSNSEWRNLGLAKASLAIINGALFLLDSLLTWRGDF